MIQGVVNRLAQNSFLLKGWSVILISALFALGASDTRASFIYLAYFPAVAFWVLDGYFLWQEKLSRALYDHVRVLKEENIDFSMDVSKADISGITWRQAFFSTTLIIFHGVILVSITIAVLLTV